ncbi:MAG: DUF3344 domain-containing protein [Methanobacterium sp.]
MNTISKQRLQKNLVLLTITLVFAMIACGAVSAGTPLAENQSGTVSGDLYVNVSSVWPATEFTQHNTLPSYTNIDSAMVYVNVYSGSGSQNWPLNLTTKIDANGDNDYDDPGEFLGEEEMNIPSSMDGTVYWLNDHCNKVYSDYQVWYDVTDLITSNNVSINVASKQTGTNYDGRIKMVALVVAYNDGDDDKIHYWVLNGQDWLNSGSSTSTFNTNTFNGEVEAATLTTVALSSTDGTYTFNSNPLTGNIIETGGYYKENQWDVTEYIAPGSDSDLEYAPVGGSLKLNLATLAIREAEEVADIDLTIDGLVNTVPSTAVFAKEPNTVSIQKIANKGTDTATNIVVALYASDVNDGTTPVATTTIASLAGGANTNINIVDPTIRDLEGGKVTYTVRLDPDNLIAETNENNNHKSSTAKDVKYNGYKGKRYWEGGSDINTSYVYDIQGNIVYYTQPAGAYKGVGWTTRTETWTPTNLPVPGTATLDDVWLYLSYNWDTTPGGVPLWTVTFNGYDIDLTTLTPYTDKSNFGFYGNYVYGLYVVNVMDMYNANGDNDLVMTPKTGNSNALYPSTLLVIYQDDNETFKQIIINEELDVLAYSETTYGTTLEEATAYAPFAISNTNLSKATLHSFAASAGPNEGNLLWNDSVIFTNAWQGTASTASAQVFDVTNYIDSANNVAGIQGTDSGSMVALQQILVLEYGADLIVTNIRPNVGLGDAFFANEPNILSVTVLNNGTLASDATTLDVDVNGTIYTVNIPSLAAGATTTVTVTDTKLHTGGSSVPVNANADPSNQIPETNKANNSLVANITVYNNGYKGKQYTDDDELDYMETQEIWEGTYNVIYSSGNTLYNGAKWTEKTYSWTASDLVIPNGATVVSARLYQGYTYNKMGVDPSWNINFNGNVVNSIIGTYKDTKGFGSFNYPYGLYVYDVTSLFNTAGNTMIITPEPENDYGIYGAYLVVVYGDATTSWKKIYINDGFDMLCSRYTYSVNDTEATAYANFEEVNTANLGNAKVVAILASADEQNDSKFLFNGQEYTGFWNDYKNGPQTGFSVYDVTSHVAKGLNVAGMQSYDSTGPGDTNWGDNMYAMTAIFVVDSGLADLVVTDMEIPETIIVGESYTINAIITNNGGTNAGTFVAKLYDNNTQKQKITLPGLNAGESTTVTFNWTPTTAGNHLLAVFADSNKQVTESDETNNILSQSATVSTPIMADITVSNLNLPETPQVGVTYTVTATVTNIGTANAGTFVVKLYDNNTQKQKITLPGLNVGESTTVTFNWTPTTAGNHVLSVIGDANHQITEIFENNNQITATTTATESTLPDITVTNLVLPENPVAGTTYTVTATVTNIGNGNAGTFVVKLYDNNTQKQKITLPGLNAGESTTVTFNWTPTTTGNHVLSVIGDANHQITETDESNNQVIKNTTVG